MKLDELLLQAAGITWRQRMLWILGLLAAAGGLLFNLLARIALWRPAGEPGLEQLDLAELLQESVTPGRLAGGVALVFLLAIIFWLLNAIAEGGLIVAVQGIQAGRSPGLAEGLRSGLGLIGRFLGIDTVLFLPLFLLALALMLVGLGGLAGLVLVTMRPAVQTGDLLLVLGLTAAVSLPILLLLLLTGVVVVVLRTLAFRAAALEGLKTGASIRRGWAVLRGKTLSVTVLLLVLWAIRSLFGMPLRLISMSLAAATLGQFMLATPGATASDGGLALLLAIGGLLVALLSWLLAGLLSAYSSTSWTMSYGSWIAERA